MAIDQARLPIIHTHAMPLVKDLWQFARYPRLPAVRLAIGRDYAILLVFLLLIDLALAAGSQGFVWVAQSLGYEPPDEIPFDVSPAFEWLTFVALAPLIEEPLSRGFLSGRRAALTFAFRACVGLTILIAWSVIGEGREGEPIITGLLALGLLILFLSGIDWLRTRKADTEIPLWFERNFHWLVWGSSLAFGLIHLSNFEGPIVPLDCIMVISQTMGGLILAYTRTRLGLTAAIAQHAAFNAIIVGLIG